MEIKYGHGLIFEVEGDAGQKKEISTGVKEEQALKDIVRDQFRTPVGPTEKISVTIDDRTYTVFNLGAKGVGMYLRELGAIEDQTVIKGMSINFGDKQFKVDGRVVHISKDESLYLCGIELSNMDPECEKEILTYLDKGRHALFP